MRKSELRYKMVSVFYIRVNGRVVVWTELKTRRDELLEILPGFFPDAEITVEAKRERWYL